MKKLAVITVLMLTLAGCNTLEGFGEDVSAGARAVDRAICTLAASSMKS